MNKEEILLDVLNEHGDFENVRQQFNENDLACIFESMERYKVQTLPIDSVSKCYTEKDMDNAYDKGFKDGNQRDLTGSLIEVL